jgi:hypothetical protein
MACGFGLLLCGCGGGSAPVAPAVSPLAGNWLIVGPMPTDEFPLPAASGFRLAMTFDVTGNKIVASGFAMDLARPLLHPRFWVARFRLALRLQGRLPPMGALRCRVRGPLLSFQFRSRGRSRRPMKISSLAAILLPLPHQSDQRALGIMAGCLRQPRFRLSAECIRERGAHEWSFHHDSNYGAGNPAARWNGDEPRDRDLLAEQYRAHREHSCRRISLFYEWCHEHSTSECSGGEYGNYGLHDGRLVNTAPVRYAYRFNGSAYFNRRVFG